MDTIKCLYCGYVQENENKFCVSCGKKLQISVEEHKFMSDNLNQTSDENKQIQEKIETDSFEEKSEEQIVESDENSKTSEINENNESSENIDETENQEKSETEKIINNTSEEELIYREPSEPSVVASYRLPEKQKKGKKRVFFWLFIIFFIISICSITFAAITYWEKDIFVEFYKNDIVIRSFNAEKEKTKGTKIQYTIDFEGFGRTLKDRYFYVKIIDPDGKVRKGPDSQYGYSSRCYIPSSGSEIISGFDEDPSYYKKGEYKLYLYYRGKKIYKITLDIN